MPDRTAGLRAAAAHAEAFLATVDERPVAAHADAAAVRGVLGGPLPEHGEDPATVIDALAAGAEPGVVATAGPRHFGFVIGGALPAALAADWLVSAWDQNAAFHSLSPAAAAIEEITSAWTLELIGLPDTASVGFVTGGQGANTTCLAAARHAVLSRAGWNVERDGLIGAPAVRILCGDQAHATIYSSLRLLGLGAETPIRIPADDQGRMHPDALATTLAANDGPTIVCAQAGNVATGAFDAFGPIADACAQHGAWLHVDGAFGLWAAAAPATAHLTVGVERADSWAVDAHKWLNVPYDCGIAMVRNAAALRAAMAMTAAYLPPSGVRDPMHYSPDASRRARAIDVWAALAHLGKAGLADLVDRCCRHAQRMAHRLLDGGCRILNEVDLNQVLVSFGDDATTDRVIERVQEDGVCWCGGTRWQNQNAMRISVSSWATTEQDVDLSAQAILTARDRMVSERAQV